MQKQPPKYALRFLRWFCREDYLEEIEGDLVELFEAQYEHEPRRARRRFYWQVMRYFRPDFLKIFDFDNPLAYSGMIKHNLLISYRSFLRNKSSFLINLTGLSTGLACVLLIYLWVNDEVKVDSFHEHDKQLYQVMLNYHFPDRIETLEVTPSLLSGMIADKFPEIEIATTAIYRSLRTNGMFPEGENIRNVQAAFTSENFFETFSWKLIEGNSKQVLAEKNSLVISRQLAQQIFGTSEGIVGRTLQWKTMFFDQTFSISGVFENLSPKSTTRFEVVAHVDNLIANDPDVKVVSDGYAETYLLLKEDTDIDQFNSKISNYLKANTNYWEDANLFVQKYADRYLYGHFENGEQAGGRITYVGLFSLIALFILLIACINFMNLATARASKKMKEIGVKKTVGASRRALTAQFLTESLLMVILSVIMAIALVAFLLPQFNLLTGKELSLYLTLELFLAFAGITLITGLIAGSYPAFYLSSFKPIAILKGKFSTASGELWVRKGLVIFQFALSVIFIVAVVVIHQQMQYTQTKNLGYERDLVLTFQRPVFTDDTEAFLEELRQIPGVVHAANMNGDFLSGTDLQIGYSWRGEPSDEHIRFKAPQLGYGMIETLGLEIIEGRSFSQAFNDDPKKIIINETALKLMQLENPIGTIISKDVGNNNKETREIIGVVKDFNYGSIHQQIEPMVLRFRPFGREVFVKIKAGTEKASIDRIEDIYKAFHPQYAFNFSFMDEEYEQLYESEARVATLSKYFSILAIIISCLGLLGLAAFTAERRIKEIGIRKILGSSSWGIVRLLSSDFTQMVLIAIVIALPVSYFTVQQWLESFAYKIDLEWWYFTGAAALTLLIAWATVGLQTLKAANINPAECLRDE